MRKFIASALLMLLIRPAVSVSHWMGYLNRAYDQAEADVLLPRIFGVTPDSDCESIPRPWPVRILSRVLESAQPDTESGCPARDGGLR